MAGFYERQAQRRRRVLELIIMQRWMGGRKELRRIFAELQFNGYDVKAYESQLIDALSIVRRAVIAINAIEGNQ